MNLEQLIISHASATLAKIKTANLININFKNKDIFLDQLYTIKEILNKKNISLEILKMKNNSSLIYIYRLDLLISDLDNNIAKDILLNNNYSGNINDYLDHLSNRLQNNDFPHEIGLFLGYPANDVKSFIINNGKNCSLCGYWKVYNNVDFALNTFKKYNKCRDLYIKNFNNKKDFNSLIV